MPAILAAAREVLAGAVNDVGGAHRPGQVRLRRAAHAGDLRPEHPGLLHRERSHAARRASDQNIRSGHTRARSQRPGRQCTRKWEQPPPARGEVGRLGCTCPRKRTRTRQNRRGHQTTRPAECRICATYVLVRIEPAPIRRLHARWRRRALVTECHSALGPISRGSPTICSSFEMSAARHARTDCQAMRGHDHPEPRGGRSPSVFWRQELELGAPGWCLCGYWPTVEGYLMPTTIESGPGSEWA